MKTKKTIHNSIAVILCLTSFWPMLKAQTYCTPPPFSSGPYTGITNVKLGNLNNTSPDNDGVKHFIKVAVPKLPLNSSQEISVSTYHGILGSGFSDKLSVRVWIDWNQDGDFFDTGEEVLKKEMADPGLIKQAFKVPSGAKLGLTRMRVYNDMPVVDAHDPANPCGYLGSSNIALGQHGEVEDYNVMVTETSSIIAGSEIVKEAIIYPNPAYGSATINVSLFTETDMEIVLTDLQGKTLKSLFNGRVNPGVHTIDFSTDGLTTGLYMIKISANDFSSSSKLIIAN